MLAGLGENIKKYFLSVIVPKLQAKKNKHNLDCSLGGALLGQNSRKKVKRVRAFKKANKRLNVYMTHLSFLGFKSSLSYTFFKIYFILFLFF